MDSFCVCFATSQLRRSPPYVKILKLAHRVKLLMKQAVNYGTVVGGGGSVGGGWVGGGGSVGGGWVGGGGLVAEGGGGLVGEGGGIVAVDCGLVAVDS